MLDYDSYIEIDAPRRGLSNRPGTLSTRSARIAMGASHLGISVEMYELHVEAGERWCSGHGRWCPATDFGKTKGSCRTGHAAYMRARNEAKKAAQAGGT